MVYLRAILSVLNDYNSYLPGRNRPARVQPWLSDRMDFSISMFWSRTETATPCDVPAARGLILGRTPPATALHCCWCMKSCSKLWPWQPARDSLSGLCGHRLTAFVLTGQKMNPFKSAGCCCEPLSSAVLLLHGQKEQSWQQRRKLPCKDQPVRLLHLSWSPSLKGSYCNDIWNVAANWPISRILYYLLKFF